MLMVLFSSRATFLLVGWPQATTLRKNVDEKAALAPLVR